ncbi:alpha/beta hydrolase family protein [Paenibacillus tuaregi]|uniref:alpha/beta hydrolase family protein n=1 Tax=Paenibacillus tuaregi TaxID=1816681 RepID=UPI000837DCEE|nr:hypothetical protein [Paenibacillus tuaregi]
MRLFEMILLLCTASSIIIYFFGKTRLSIKALSGWVSLAILAVHLLTEGYRWPLLPLYFIVLLFSALSLYQYYKKPPLKKRRPVHTALISSILAAVLFISGGLMVLFPFFQLPEPTGQLSVGTQTLHLIDKSRQEIFAADRNPNRKRELMVQLWYPAEAVSGDPAPFISSGSKMIKAVAQSIGMPAFLFNHLNYIPSNSYKDAAIAKINSTYPLVILNHGFSSSRVYQTSYAENLASHGYIVASIDHTYSTAATVFPDGRTTYTDTSQDMLDTSDTYRDKLGGEWTKDILFTLDQLEKMNKGTVPSIFKGKIDLNHMGVFGHSLGGAASYDAAYDPRIKAGMDLDGSLFNYRNKHGFNKPFMFMMSDQGFNMYKRVIDKQYFSDQELKELDTTPGQYKRDVDNMKAMFKHYQHVVRQGGEVVYVQGTKHNNFMDQQLFSPLITRLLGITGSIDGERSIEIVNRYVLDFFDKHLKNTGGDLLTGPNPNYREVKFISSTFSKLNQT